jgi:hypothetical protein
MDLEGSPTPRRMGRLAVSRRINFQLLYEEHGRRSCTYGNESLSFIEYWNMLDQSRNLHLLEEKPAPQSWKFSLVAVVIL